MQITSIWLVHHTDNKWSKNFDERPVMVFDSEV